MPPLPPPARGGACTKGSVGIKFSEAMRGFEDETRPQNQSTPKGVLLNRQMPPLLPLLRNTKD
jgi:hypothetical protein